MFLENQMPRIVRVETLAERSEFAFQLLHGSDAGDEKLERKACAIFNYRLMKS